MPEKNPHKNFQSYHDDHPQPSADERNRPRKKPQKDEP